jgi:hypothetical protein
MYSSSILRSEVLLMRSSAKKNLSCATVHQTFTLALTTRSITISGFFKFHTQQLCLFMYPPIWNVSSEKTITQHRSSYSVTWKEQILDIWPSSKRFFVTVCTKPEISVQHIMHCESRDGELSISYSQFLKLQTKAHLLASTSCGDTDDGPQLFLFFTVPITLTCSTQHTQNVFMRRRGITLSNFELSFNIVWMHFMWGCVLHETTCFHSKI